VRRFVSLNIVLSHSRSLKLIHHAEWKPDSLGVKSQISWFIFLCNSGMLDMTEALRKFYGSFNNIMSIIGKQSNEMVAVHLAKTYCLPSLTYGCKVWNIDRSTLHKMNVAWNACFRRIFGGFYIEKV